MESDQQPTVWAILTVETAMAMLGVGPEKVIAADPADVQVDWDTEPSPDRVGKLRAIWTAVRAEIRPFLHQMPEVLIIDDTGGVVGVHRGLSTTLAGTVIPPS